MSMGNYANLTDIQASLLLKVSGVEAFICEHLGGKIEDYFVIRREEEVLPVSSNGNTVVLAISVEFKKRIDEEKQLFIHTFIIMPDGSVFDFPEIKGNAFVNSMSFAYSLEGASPLIATGNGWGAIALYVFSEDSKLERCFLNTDDGKITIFSSALTSEVSDNLLISLPQPIWQDFIKETVKQGPTIRCYLRGNEFIRL